MKTPDISVVTPCFNGGRFLEKTVASVCGQRSAGVDVEYIVIDGGSTDNSHEILRRHGSEIDTVVIEPDHGPANAINKGLRLANAPLLAWLGCDDLYRPGALPRVKEFMAERPERPLCFGGCLIIDEQGREIRQRITRFKEFFFPMSSRFTVQCINYVSQPAMFFRKDAFERAGALREDLVAAWDYDFILRLWRQGGAARIPGPPLSSFRWHDTSISGSGFTTQFREEWQAAAADAGRFSPQSLAHLFVWWGIVTIYSLMAKKRRETARPL